MADIYTVSITDLMPDSLKRDPDVVALAQAIYSEFEAITQEIIQCILLPRIDDLDSELIDLLAWQFHVDFYDPSLSLEIRRQLVKNSLKWHRIKGTPAAIDELITTVFGDGKVVEWFEFGGDPYHFKVVTSNVEITQDKADQFLRALNTVKNTRSYFDGIELNDIENLDLYYGGLVHIGEKLEFRQVN